MDRWFGASLTRITFIAKLVGPDCYGRLGGEGEERECEVKERERERESVCEVR